nr:MAG TPA: hypothetical protein [Caudoviricetes sp.]
MNLSTFNKEQANSLYLSTMTGVDYQIMQDSPTQPILLVCPGSTYSHLLTSSKFLLLRLRPISRWVLATL